MKEIGGYLELENFAGQEYYPDLLKFNLARTAIAWFLPHVGCKKLYFPTFICASVTNALKDTGIEIISYPINADFTPDFSILAGQSSSGAQHNSGDSTVSAFQAQDSPQIPAQKLPDDTWLFVNNAYGQLSNSVITDLKEKYGNILVDFTHAFFQAPLPGVASVCSVRKFFGVTDGAYLQSDREISLPEETDQSHSRYGHVLGRYEAPAGDFYQMMLDNAHGYEGAVARQMSPLTRNILKAIDYRKAASQRLLNYFTLSKMLDDRNALSKAGILRTPDGGPFVYPLLVPDGISLRKKLASKKIFVPTYWSELINTADPSTIEYNYAANILALPCDQRYTEEDMMYVARTVIAELI